MGVPRETEPTQGRYAAAGQYRVLVSLSPRGYVAVAVVHRLWNGAEVMDHRLDRIHYTLDPGVPAAMDRRALLASVLEHLRGG